MDNQVEIIPQNRFKSPVLWSALSAQILAILVLFNVITVSTSEQITAGIVLVLQMLVTVGIFNNNNAKNKF